MMKSPDLRRLRLLLLPLIALTIQACTSTGGSSSPDAAAPTAAGIGTGSVGSAAPPAAAGSGSVVPAIAGVPPSRALDTTYRIGPDDLLKIEVFEVEELSSEERVSEDGFIVMPLIGGVRLGGLTPREAEREIAQALGRNYLQNPQVNVFVSEYASQDVTVTGSVKQPGVYPIKGRTTLLQAIAMAGGIDKLAREEEVVIFRDQGTSNAKAYVVDLEKIHEGTLVDPVLVADDRIVVPESGTAAFFEGLKDYIRIPVIPLY
jgi:polysaccharide export outer membrane protein